MIEYRVLLKGKPRKEATLMHRIKKFIDDTLVVGSVGTLSLFNSYEEANPMNSEVSELIKQHNGRLLAYHYIPRGLILTARFDSREEAEKLRQELIKRDYNPRGVGIPWGEGHGFRSIK
ncbi:hypothetical protein FJZ19_01905 [Candidatus Pacearchaeota archaeon]|nr:hypothetical protein [Candidatus Pacearchaeota archaeon]